MIIFLQEYFFNLLILSSLAGMGAFGVLPFARDIKYPLLVAPFMGLVFVVLGTATMHAFLHQSLALAAMIATASCFAMTVITFLVMRVKYIIRIDVSLIFFMLLLIAVLTYYTNYTSIRLGEHGFLYMDGTDHLGYAHLADWLNHHVGAQYPKESISIPYESWPNMLFNIDPRFGSFIALALNAQLRGVSAMFAYDSACAVILSAAILAVSAIFSRSKMTFILLSVGLMLSCWYDYSRQGFFGKLLSYSSTLMALGLYLIAKRPLSSMQITLLAVLAAGATVMHSYLSTGLFYAVIGGLFLLTQFLSAFLQKQSNAVSLLQDNAALLALLILVIIATGGTLSRPYLFIGGGAITSDWSSLMLSMFDFKIPNLRVVLFSNNLLLVMLAISAAITFIYLIIAWHKREQVAVSLLLASCILPLVLIAAGAKWQATQVLGTFYPWFLCGAVRCIDSLNLDKKTVFLSFSTLLTLLYISIALHIPRFITSVKRYASKKVPSSQQFSASELKQLAQLIGKEKLTVDLDNTTYALPILVELGRQQISLQWTAASWKAILGYRPWAAPTLDDSSIYWLTRLSSPIKKDCKTIYQTRQYRLLDCSHSIFSNSATSPAYTVYGIRRA